MDELIILNEINNNIQVLENLDNPDRDFWSKWRREDPFTIISDKQFIKLFRLSKPLVLSLLEDIDEYLSPPSRRSALPKKFKLLVALQFFASGSYQTNIGVTKYVAVSQSSVSRCVSEVTAALNQNRIFNKWVYFHRNMVELNSARRRFYQDSGIPGIIGVIDCTHVAIYPPTGDDHPEHIYVNRKQYHSINTQLICDLDMRILNVNSRFPGSTHDAYIWNNSNISQHMQDLNRDHSNFFLIGDSGYPLRKWLQTPVRNPLPDSPEEAYNRAFCQARCTIERCNGLLKMRFRCLLKHRVLHYTPTVASKIINACTVLHNICICHNLPDPEPVEGDDDVDFGMDIFNDFENEGRDIRNIDLEDGRRLQSQIIRSHFA